MRKPDIAISAGHLGTVGNYNHGIREEDVVQALTKEIVKEGTRRGLPLYTLGTKEHEMDQDDVEGVHYDVIMSQHTNVGAAMLLWNQNPAQLDALNKQFGALVRGAGFRYDGAIHRYGENGLDMLWGDNDNAERYLFEWIDARDLNQQRWVMQYAARAKDFVDMLENVYYGGNNTITPAPKPPLVEAGYGLISDNQNKVRKIWNKDTRISAFHDVTRTKEVDADGNKDVDWMNGEYMTTTDREYLVRIKGDDNYIMVQSATSGYYFAIGTWYYDTNNRHVVDEMYKVDWR